MLKEEAFKGNILGKLLCFKWFKKFKVSEKRVFVNSHKDGQSA